MKVLFMNGNICYLHINVYLLICHKHENKKYAYNMLCVYD